MAQEKIVALTDLENWVQEFAAKLPDRAIILLEGELGVGKTQLTKFLCTFLEIPYSASPTYSLINEYQGTKQMLYHLDLYRLENQQDLESIGFWDLFSAESAWICIEWADKLDPEQLPLTWPRYQIQLSYHKEGAETERVLSYRQL